MIRPTKYNQYVWCLFDWARTVWPVLIITFVFPNYFSKQVAETALQGDVYWANIMVISGILTAVLAPFIGLIADTIGKTMLWLRLFTLINVACAFGLWFVEPNPSFITLAMTLVIIGTIGFEISGAFYNSILMQVTKPAQLSRLSGIAWGLGYISGICCLILCLTILVLPDEPLFGYITKDLAQHIRIIGPVVGGYYLLFASPLMLLSDNDTPNDSPPLYMIAKSAYQKLIQSIYKAKKQPYIFWFLVYRMIYTDGINTLFGFAGLYAGTAFGMDLYEIMYFGVACNLTAGLGCFIASYSDSIIGEQKTILISLFALTLFLLILLMVDSIFFFWVYALIATVFIGPLQTSSRSLMAKITPEESKGEFFGLYALSGRVTSFIGPFLYGSATKLTGSETIGMSTITIFLVIGFIGMSRLVIPVHIILPKETD